MKIVIDKESLIRMLALSLYSIVGGEYSNAKETVAELVENVGYTPLPKGHGDLKDADIYKAKVGRYITENKNSDDLYLSGCGDGAYHALHIYDYLPTIIAKDGGEDGKDKDNN